MIDDEPCKVVEVAKAKVGKHGSAKVRIIAMGLFDGNKRSLVCPVDTRVEAPILTKGKATITFIDRSRAAVQLMDLASYNTFEVQLEDEFEERLSEGLDVEYWEILGRKRIVRVEKES